MKKGTAIYFIVFAIVFSLIALSCAVNIILNLTALQKSDEVSVFFSDLSTFILSAATIVNAAAGIIISVVLIVKKQFKTAGTVTLTACICSLIAVLAAFLI